MPRLIEKLQFFELADFPPQTAWLTVSDPGSATNSFIKAQVSRYQITPSP